MKAYEVITRSEEENYTFRYCTFLDTFFRSKNKDEVIRDEPTVKGTATPQQEAQLAAAVHYLANKESIRVPEWVMKDRYFLDSPVYPFDETSQEYKDFMARTTPPEFAVRKVLFGDNVCKRV